jgi:hypothetical protein
VNGCHERKTEKRHECTNWGQLQTNQIMMANVPLRHFLFRSFKLQAVWFLSDWVHNKLQATVTLRNKRANPADEPYLETWICSVKHSTSHTHTHTHARTHTHKLHGAIVYTTLLWSECWRRVMPQHFLGQHCRKVSQLSVYWNFQRLEKKEKKMAKKGRKETRI